MEVLNCQILKNCVRCLSNTVHYILNAHPGKGFSFLTFLNDVQNEYFMVEKAKTKHSGFFINRGALEKMFVSFSLLS